MNLIAVAPLWLIIVLALALVAGAAEDAARLRISNITCLVVAAGAIAAMVIAGGSISLWQNLALFAAILILGTFAFSAGWLGGGDVKLLAAVGLWVDLRSGVSLLTAILLSGGLVAIAFLAFRIVCREGIKSARQRRIPYGMAIALGTLISILVVREPQRRRPAPIFGVSVPVTVVQTSSRSPSRATSA
jgi:prepilin peptidase CpaA